MTAADDQTVIGVRPHTSRRTQIAMVIVVLAYLVLGLVDHHYMLLVFVAVAGLHQFRVTQRPLTVVSSDGIRRPWSLRSVLTWDQVTSIAHPEPGRWAVRLNLVGGKAVSLVDIPAAQSAMVAAIGGKDVVAPTAPPKIAPTPRPPTDEMRHAEVQRKAAELRAGWRRLAEESGRIPPPRP